MRRTSIFLAIAFGSTAWLACGHEQSPLVEPQPSTPDEALFQAALTLYDAMNYAEAQPKFDELWTTYPNSNRRDNAGYLRGR